MSNLLLQYARRDNEKNAKRHHPTLMKGQQMRFNRFGVEEKEDDSLEDILHPDKAEQEMETAQKRSMQRMMEMQKQGGRYLTLEASRR